LRELIKPLSNSLVSSRYVVSIVETICQKTACFNYDPQVTH
jgi:hypothetical protein